ncbi:MAG: DUF1499 domain-containing protein [Stellaceae bacterium]
MLAQLSAHLAAALILLTAALMLAAPLGFRLHLWSAITALTKVVALGLVAGALAALLAAVSLAAGGWQVGPGTTIMLLATIVIGAAAIALPLRVKRLAERTPFNDVSTDTANAPLLDAVLPLRRAEVPDATGNYDRARLAALQQRTYPDLLPRTLAAAPGEAFTRALDAAKAMGWTIVAADAARGRIEATDKTRWFGFVDDIVIRLTPAAAGTRVDMRSASRVGISDLGKNAARIRAYLATLAAAG